MAETKLIQAHSWGVFEFLLEDCPCGTWRTCPKVRWLRDTGIKLHVPKLACNSRWPAIGKRVRVGSLCSNYIIHVCHLSLFVRLVDMLAWTRRPCSEWLSWHWAEESPRLCRCLPPYSYRGMHFWKGGKVNSSACPIVPFPAKHKANEASVKSPRLQLRTHHSCVQHQRPRSRLDECGHASHFWLHLKCHHGIIPRKGRNKERISVLQGTHSSVTSKPKRLADTGKELLQDELRWRKLSRRLT